MPNTRIPNFAVGDAEKFLFKRAGSQKTKLCLFIRRREKIKAAQQMNERYWNKKSQRFAESVLNLKPK